MRLYWTALAGAIAAEIIATSAMKASDGLSKWGPATISISFYLAAGWALAFAMKRIDLSIAYAIWSGIGLVATAAIGMTLFGESITVAKLGFTALILIGVVGLSLTAGH